MSKFSDLVKSLNIDGNARSARAFDARVVLIAANRRREGRFASSNPPLLVSIGVYTRFAWRALVAWLRSLIHGR